MVEQVLPGGEGWEWAVAKTIYTHVSKCKNDKILKIQIQKDKYHMFSVICRS
jgi:hypothetical protein